MGDGSSCIEQWENPTGWVILGIPLVCYTAYLFAYGFLISFYYLILSAHENNRYRR